MTINVRKGLFETNSSSTHSITICSEKEYFDWKEGKLLFDPSSDEFIDNYLLSDEKKTLILKEYYETRIKEDKKFLKDFSDLSKEEIRELTEMAVEDGFLFQSDSDKEIDVYELEYLTYDQYFNQYEDHLEDYFASYTSESGDKIVAFGKYGHE